MDENYSSYSEMLEIPVNTCSITFKEDKKKSSQRKKLINLEKTKKKLLDKINGESVAEQKNGNGDNVNAVAEEQVVKEEKTATVIPNEVTIKNKKSNTVSRYFAKISKNIRKINIKKPDIISVQIAVIICLSAVISLSAVFNKNSGIAVFMKSVFGSEKLESISSKNNYNDYTVNLGYEDYDLSNGVITVSDSGSVYSPLEGIITNVSEELGKYVVEISQSKNFSTKISGLTYAFCKVGDSVYGNIPVGYMTEDNYSVCFYNDGGIIDNYSIEENQIVWQK